MIFLKMSLLLAIVEPTKLASNKAKVGEMIKSKADKILMKEIMFINAF
jgi:hypothetical protein